MKKVYDDLIIINLYLYSVQNRPKPLPKQTWHWVRFGWLMCPVSKVLAPPQWKITVNFTHFDIEGNNVRSQVLLKLLKP